MKLTDAQKADVIRDFAANMTVNQIARKYKVSHHTISAILKNGKAQTIAKNANESANNKKSRKEYQRLIVDSAYTALVTKDFNDLPAETLLKIIERMTYMENISTDDITQREELSAIVDQIKAVANGVNDEAD